MAKIFVFSCQKDGRAGLCVAMGEDGVVLGEHFCSSEFYAPQDLGVTPGTRPDRHLTYRMHYPDGYEMEFIPAAKLKDHRGWLIAWAINQQQKPRHV